jgi:hypothetical protein
MNTKRPLLKITKLDLIYQGDDSDLEEEVTDVASQLFESYLEALEESHVYILPKDDKEAKIIQDALSGNHKEYLELGLLHKLSGSMVGSAYWTELYSEHELSQPVRDSISKSDSANNFDDTKQPVDTQISDGPTIAVSSLKGLIV